MCMVLMGVMMMLVALARSLLGHHSIEVMATHACLIIDLMMMVMILVLRRLLLEQDLGWHVLNLDKCSHSIVWI